MPEKEELQYREKEFLLNLYEAFEGFSKKLLIILLVVIVGAFPLAVFLKSILTNLFVSSYVPPFVNEQPYTPQGLQVLKTDLLAVSSGVFSAYAQLLNPNPDLSVRKFAYRFVFRGSDNSLIDEVDGESFMLGGESKFLLAPIVELESVPSSVELVIDGASWTAWTPAVSPELEVLQKNTGRTLEGQFFVEGLIQNSQGFIIKKVEIELIAFDASNQKVAGINSTAISDLKPFESRYFRAIWPIGFSSLGEVEVIPLVNPFGPGLILEQVEDIPAR